MNFQEKYVTSAEAIKPENKNKVIISNDAYAVGEMILELINSIELARRSIKD